jgi:hypothetical protein
MYSMVLVCCMKMNDHESAVKVVKLLIDACLEGRCQLHDEAYRLPYNWIIDQWIALDKLVEVTLLLEAMFQIRSSTTNASNVLGLREDHKTVLDLRKAWTTSSHPEKQHYITKIDSGLIPAIVNALNIQQAKVR